MAAHIAERLGQYVEQSRRHQADGQRAGQTLACGPGLARSLVQAEQAAFDVVGNSQSRRCGQGAAARALEKFHAQAFFHARNGLAKSGLRDAQLMGGLTDGAVFQTRSEEYTSEIQSLMRTSYDVFCLKNKKTNTF